MSTAPAVAAPARPLVLEALPEPAVRRGPYTEAALDALDDPRPVELLGGHLLAVRGASPVHRAVCWEILGRFAAWATRCSARVLGRDPFTVRLAADSVVRPDVGLVLRLRRPAPDARHEVLPDLVVEVLDGDDARRERDLKVRLYAEAGVREYWIVDPRARTVDFLVLEDGRYGLCPLDDGLHRARSVPGLLFDVADLWWDVDQLVPLGF